MRRVVRSRTYVVQLQAMIEEGARNFGVPVAMRTLSRIDRTIEQYLAHFPAGKTPDPALGLTAYPISKTPFVVLYDFDDDEVRVHFILYAAAGRSDLDPQSAQWE